jgi:hypothetical protein
MEISERRSGHAKVRKRIIVARRRWNVWLVLSSEQLVGLAERECEEDNAPSTEHRWPVVICSVGRH